MFWLYCLPGRLFAALGFLWPGKGDVTGTARRRDSKLVHFLYASIFWGLLAMYLSGSFSRQGKARDGGHGAQVVEASPEISTDSAPQSEAVSEMAAEPDADLERAGPPSSVVGEDSAPVEEAMIANAEDN